MEIPFSSYRGDEPHLFVSYSHKDSALVYAEMLLVHQGGFNVWYDEGISPGGSWSNELADAILGARALLFFGTQNSADSPNCINEVSFALDNGIPVLAAYLSDTTMPVGMQLRLNTQQAIFKRRDNADRFRNAILDGLGKLMGPGAPERRTQTSQLEGRKRKRWLIPVVLALLVVTGAAITLINRVEPVADSLEMEAFEEGNFVITHQTIAIEPFSTAPGVDANVALDIQNQMTVEMNAETSVSVMLFKRDEAGVRQPNYFLQGDITTVGGSTTLTMLLVNSDSNTIEWSENYPIESTFDSKKVAVRTTNSIVRFLFSVDHFREEYLEDEDPEAVRLLAQTSQGGSDLIVEQRWKAIARLAKTDQLHDYAYLELTNLIIDKMEPLESDSEVAHAYLAEARNQQSTMYLMRLSQVLVYIDLDFAKAKTTLEQGIGKAPTDFMWYFLLSKIAGAEGRISDALSWSNTALGADLYGGRYYALIGHALLLHSNGAFEDALAFFDQADELYEGSADAYKHYALIRVGRTEEARMVLERLLQFDLSDPAQSTLPVDVLYIYIQPLLALGQRARGELLLQRTLDQWELNKNVDLFFVAEGYFELGDMDRGFEFLERAIKARSWYAAETLRSKLKRDQLGHDGRYEEMLVLLDTLQTHTDQYARN